jgi:putative membrane protein
MKFLTRVVTVIIAIIFFGFALKNTQEATLNFFMGYEIRGPFVLLLFGFFLSGTILGVFGMLPTYVRHRRELSRHKKMITTLQKEQDALRTAQQAPPPDSLVSR